MVLTQRRRCDGRSLAQPAAWIAGSAAVARRGTDWPKERDYRTLDQAGGKVFSRQRTEDPIARQRPARLSITRSMVHC